MTHSHDPAHPHDEWCRPLPPVKPFPRHASLADTQVALDRERLHGRPWLRRRKWLRMTASPFGFLRGAAPLFDECLRREGSWARGPAGGGSVVGDLHLENFGVFLDEQGRPNFHVNDFDSLRDGPWRFDVLRLLTSVLLARNELHATGPAISDLALEVLEGHQAGLSGLHLAPPPFIRQVLKAAAEQNVTRLFRKHLEGRRILRDERHPRPPAKLVARVPQMLARWSSLLPAGRSRPTPDQLRVLDVRRRVLGVGSLGAERLLVLVKGRARGRAPDGLWLLDVKEVQSSGERVVEATRAAVTRAPALLGASLLGTTEVLVRKLSAGDEKLSLEAIKADQAQLVARFLGALAGEVHLRLARTRPKRWSPRELSSLRASARRLAAMHEEAFLDFSALGA